MVWVREPGKERLGRLLTCCCAVLLVDWCVLEGS